MVGGYGLSKEAALEKNIYKKVFEATANIKFVESLKDKKDDDVVLVNSNWINGLIPVAARCIKEDHKRSEVMSKLHRAIDRLDGEWDVYVPMYVNEVKICAGNRSEYPINTFREASEKDKKRLKAIKNN